MSGKARPSLRKKTLENVMRSNLSQTDKDCIATVFKRYETDVVKEIKVRAVWICCPLCDEEKCVGKDDCIEIKNYVDRRLKEREKE